MDLQEYRLQGLWLKYLISQRDRTQTLRTDTRPPGTPPTDFRRLKQSHQSVVVSLEDYKRNVELA